MDKAKVISLLLIFASTAAFAQKEFAWRRVAMDGSRRTDSARIEASPSAKKMVAFVDSFHPGMAQLKEVVGFSPVELRKGRPESALGNWCADLMIAQAERITGRKCDVCITNVGGLRVDMPQGDVTVEDMRAMFPFKNNITIVTLTGERLWQILSGMASRAWEVTGGMRIVADSSKLISVEIGGQPLEPGKTYTLVTNDFLLHGGDHLYLGEDAISVEITDCSMYDAMMNNLKQLREEGKQITGAKDGRVTIVGAVGKKDNKKIRNEAVAPAPAKKDFRLTILHTNDTHSHIEPIRSGSQKDMGGVLERAIFIDSVRVADGKRNVLLLDAGDFEQGTPYFGLFGGKAEIGSMNIMGYDVATMGNHEWDNGGPALTERLRKARFKKVLCNYNIADDALRRTFKPYVIVRRGGLKIGIIGILADVTSLCDKDKSGGLEFLEPSGPVTEWATFLKERKRCDLVIVLSHYGIGGPGEEDSGDLDMVPKTRNVDMVIGGHTHTNLKAPVYSSDADGRPVMVVTDWMWGQYVGEIKY